MSYLYNNNQVKLPKTGCADCAHLPQVKGYVVRLSSENREYKEVNDKLRRQLKDKDKLIAELKQITKELSQGTGDLRQGRLTEPWIIRKRPLAMTFPNENTEHVPFVPRNIKPEPIDSGYEQGASQLAIGSEEVMEHAGPQQDACEAASSMCEKLLAKIRDLESKVHAYEANLQAMRNRLIQLENENTEMKQHKEIQLIANRQIVDETYNKFLELDTLKANEERKSEAIANFEQRLQNLNDELVKERADNQALKKEIERLNHDRNRIMQKNKKFADKEKEWREAMNKLMQQIMALGHVPWETRSSIAECDKSPGKVAHGSELADNKPAGLTSHYVNLDAHRKMKRKEIMLAGLGSAAGCIVELKSDLQILKSQMELNHLYAQQIEQALRQCLVRISGQRSEDGSVFDKSELVKQNKFLKEQERENNEHIIKLRNDISELNSIVSKKMQMIEFYRKELDTQEDAVKRLTAVVSAKDKTLQIKTLEDRVLQSE